MTANLSPLTKEHTEYGYQYYLLGVPAICLDNAGTEGLPGGESVLTSDRKVYGLSGNNEKYLKGVLPAGTVVYIDRCGGSYGPTSQMWVQEGKMISKLK